MAVLLDAVGPGGLDQNPFFNGQQVRFNHTANGGDLLALVGLSYSASDLALGPFVIATVNLSDLTRTVTWGGAAMISLGVVEWATDKAWTEVFALHGVPGGQVEVKANVWGGIDSWRTLRCESVTYSGVDSIGTPVTSSGTGTTLTASATAPTNGAIAGVFGSRAGLYTPSSSNLVQRYANNDVIGLLMGEARGTGSSQSISVNRDGGGTWSGMLIPMYAADDVATCDPLIVQPSISSTVHRLPRVGGLRRNVFTVPAQ